jgi:hypothetical protein
MPGFTPTGSTITETGGERKSDVGGKEILAPPAWKWFLEVAKGRE